MSSYTGLGLMSGTSLDGLDICCVEFTGDISYDIWSYRIRAAHTVPYDATWRERLAGAKALSGLELIRLHYDYAHFTGKAIQVSYLSYLEGGGIGRKEQRDARGRHYTMLYLRGDGGSMMGERVWRRRRRGDWRGR